MIIEREFKQSRDELTGRPINLPTGKLIIKDNMRDTELEETKKGIWPELYDNPDGWPVLWEGKLYCGIREFDCIRVDLFTEPTMRGGYFTVIPISAAEFRRDNPTKAKALIVNRGEWTEFTIWDDWGEGHVMKIHNSLSAEISSAIEGAKRNEIPISPRPKPLSPLPNSANSGIGITGDGSPIGRMPTMKRHVLSSIRGRRRLIMFISYTMFFISKAQSFGINSWRTSLILLRRLNHYWGKICKQ